MENLPYNLDLFERLNAEYEANPLVPAAPRTDDAGRKKRARTKLRQIGAGVELDGKRVLEVGCAHGHLTKQIRRKGAAHSVIGIDIVESATWEELRSRRVNFVHGDLARERLLPDGSVDVVVSNSVLEHVKRPLAMLEAIAAVLSVGGTAWLMFNLYRGPKASHRYRELFFPWPHLLFEPSVCRAFYRKHHGVETTFSWVNHLTAAEYVDAAHAVGLEIASIDRRVTPIDITFYQRFEDKLGRYPALDLETDFLLLVLKKPRRWRRRRRPAPLGYPERQREFDAQLSAHSP